MTSENPKKIALNIRTLNVKNIRGFSRHIMNLIKVLEEQKDIELTLISERPLTPDQLPSLKSPANIVINKKWPAFLWLNFYLPFYLNKKGIETYHAPANVGVPLLQRLFPNIKTLVTIHDIMDHERVLKESLSLFKILYLTSFWMNHFAHKLLTVSSYSKSKIQAYFPNSTVEVIGNSVEDSFYFNNPQKEANKYFFYVGGFDQRKNIPALLEAYKVYLSRSSECIPLYIAGKMNSSIRDKLENIKGAEERIKFIGYVDDEELKDYYHRAYATVIPSLEEGFGLQVAESISALTPVLCSHTSSLPEVAQNSALYFNPENIADIANALVEIEKNKNLYKELQSQCYEDRGLFTQSNFAKRYLDHL